MPSLRITSLLPGGARAAIAAVRIGKNVDHAVDAAKVFDKVSDVPKTTKHSNRIENLQKTAEIGKEAHRQIERDYKALYPHAETEINLVLNNGKTIRKDVILPDGTCIIIKPDTKNGHLSAKRRENLLKENNYEKIKVHYYDPTDSRWIPDSPTYMGPKR